MTTTDRTAYWKARRDRLRGGPPRQPAPCGTWAAVMRHYRHGEDLCDKCVAARAEHNAAQYAKRKARTDTVGT